MSGEPPARSILTHEHILGDFVGADTFRPGRYDPDEVFRLALPNPREVRILECTPTYFGRDPPLLLRLARAANVEL